MARRSKPDLPPDPPEHLSEAARDLWRHVVTKPVPAGKAALVETAPEARDRADQASHLLRTEGLTATTGAVHVHPAVKI